MNNTDQVHENMDAARQFEPLIVVRAWSNCVTPLSPPIPTFCTDCDGRCASGGRDQGKGLGDLTRYLTYYEHHGYRERGPADTTPS